MGQTQLASSREEQIAIQSALTALMDEKILAILSVLFTYNDQLTLSEIAKKANVPLTSAHRIMKRLTEVHVAQKVDIKQLTLYRAAHNAVTAHLRQFVLTKEEDVVMAALRLLIEDTGVDVIYSYGEETPSRINILAIGQPSQLLTDRSREFSQLLKEKSITAQTVQLTAEQYKQMLDMGVYAGKKRELYRS